MQACHRSTRGHALAHRFKSFMLHELGIGTISQTMKCIVRTVIHTVVNLWHGTGSFEESCSSVDDIYSYIPPDNILELNDFPLTTRDAQVSTMLSE